VRRQHGVISRRQLLALGYSRNATASGLTPLCFSRHQVKHEPAHVVAILRATASRLQRAGSQKTY
jgi:hypothetical protein